MDALGKVPDNIPNQAEISKHLGKPLTSTDPFGEYASFGEHNNNKLKSFLINLSLSMSSLVQQIIINGLLNRLY